MHLQQTKSTSRKSGGPQYYFHDLLDSVKEFLRKRGACEVVLETPYGIAASHFMAVDRNHKLEQGQPVPGRVGHDRIQQAGATESIGEAIRKWFGFPDGQDFERIDVEIRFDQRDDTKDTIFVLVPTAVKLRDSQRTKTLPRVISPLSIYRGFQSNLWKEQIANQRRRSPEDVQWARTQIERVVSEHRHQDARHILESDLLRTCGALSLLGVELSPYLGKGYDCATSQFQFQRFPPYPCPVEVKKRSQGFEYQIVKYSQLPRAVVLCMKHDHVRLPANIDVIELPALAEQLASA